MRLIDADALMDKHRKEERERYGGTFVVGDNRFMQRFMDAPTVDAVPVVRCKECDYCKRYNDVWRFPKRDERVCTLYVETYDTTENDYCSRGERRKDGTLN